ncbi:MAG: acyltransferase [Cyanobacteria bacterium P01_A01_bin.83]
MKQQRLFWLDVVRGLCAVAVCTGHLRVMLFIDYSELQSASVINKILYFVTGIGHQAVMVLFVLSGFFVGGSILKSRANFSWIEYLIARLSRLWIVLIPALLFTFLIDQVIQAVAPDILAGAYYSLWNSGPLQDHSYSDSWRTFLGNTFFLQKILTPIYGTNDPLWSLTNEFWYYILFPLCAYASGNYFNRSKPQLYLRVAAALAALTIFLWLPAPIRLGYFVWLMGVIIYLIYARMSRITVPLLLIGTVMFMASLAYSESFAWQEILNLPKDLVVGVAFSVLCLGLLNLPNPATGKLGLVKLIRGLSEFSYSLYLSHFPPIILIGALFYDSEQLLPNFLGFAHFALWLALLTMVAVLFWWLFEKRTYRVRKFIISHLR